VGVVGVVEMVGVVGVVGAPSRREEQLLVLLLLRQTAMCHLSSKRPLLLLNSIGEVVEEVV